MKHLSPKKLAQLLVDICEPIAAEDLPQALEACFATLQAKGYLFQKKNLSFALEAVWKRRFGAASVQVETPFPLSKEAKENLQKRYPHATYTEVVDPALRAGIRVRVDDRLFDGTVSGMVSNLKSTLSS